MRGLIMAFESYSLSKLKQQIDEIELVADQIDFLSFEKLKCLTDFDDLQSKCEDYRTIEFIISASSLNSKNPIMEFIKKDQKLKNRVTKIIIELYVAEQSKKYEKYLKRIELYLNYYKTINESRSPNNEISGTGYNTLNNKNSYDDRIVLKCKKESIFEVFDCLHKNEIIPSYSKIEILSHFVDEKRIPYSRSNINPYKFNWLDSDSSFAVFIDELAKRGAIDDENKYKVITKHFLNKKGTEFKNLAQKKNYTDNYTKSGNLIREIMNKIEF
jgi:hypothetical protein